MGGRVDVLGLNNIALAQPPAADRTILFQQLLPKQHFPAVFPRTLQGSICFLTNSSSLLKTCLTRKLAEVPSCCWGKRGPEYADGADVGRSSLIDSHFVPYYIRPLYCLLPGFYRIFDARHPSFSRSQ